MICQLLVTANRPAGSLSGEGGPKADFTSPAAAAPRRRKVGVVRRVADELYEFVDLRTRERYEYRRRPL